MIYTTQRRRFVYDTWDNGSRLDRVMVECTLSIAHCLRLNLQLHAIHLVRTCRISSFCTVPWQLARFQLTRRIARSLGDSWASCSFWMSMRHAGDVGGSPDRVSRKCSLLINVDKTKAIASDCIACRVVMQNELLVIWLRSRALDTWLLKMVSVRRNSLPG